MYPSLYSTHGLQGTLKQSQRSTHRGVRTHVANIHITDGTQSATFFSNLIQQCKQSLAWLLVRERHNIIPDRSARNVHIPELARSNRCVITLDTQPTGLQTTRQVTQRTCINQLANQRCTCPSITTDQVNQTQSVSTEAGYVGILHEVLALEFLLVVLFPVTANRKNCSRTALDSNYIRQSNTIFVFKTRQVKVSMNLIQLVTVVVCQRVSLLLSLLLLYVSKYMDWITKLNITVEPSDLQLAYLILCLTHYVSYTL